MENENVPSVENAQPSSSRADVEFGGLKIGSSGIFNRYKPIEEVAKDLVRDMAYRGYYREKVTGRRKRNYSVEGLIMSDEQLLVGALSIAPALSTIFMELSKIKDDKELYAVLNQSAVEPEEGQKSGRKDDLTLLDVIKNSIMMLLAECYNKEGDKTTIVFEASPFYNENDVGGADSDNVKWAKSTEVFLVKNKDKVFTNHVCEVGGYLDTASWVFLLTQLARNFLDRVINLGNGENGQATDSTLLSLLTNETEWVAPLNFPEDLKQYVKNTADVRTMLNELYMASLRFACRCIVHDKNDKSRYTGWMFTKSASGEIPDYDPDLYMSYAASTMYLGLYNEYAQPIVEDPGRPLLKGKNVLSELRLLEHFMAVAEQRNGYTDACIASGITNKDYFTCFMHDTRNIRRLQEYVDRLWELVEKSENANELMNAGLANPSARRPINEIYEEIKQFLSYLDERALLKTTAKDISNIEFLFCAINGKKPLTRGKEDATYGAYENTPIYTILKEATVASARYFWEGEGDRSFRKNMALGPCYSDGTPATADSYARAGHSNVLFNNLLAIGLIVNSAYDLEILKQSADDYNDMLQSFQIAVQDTQRRYNLMSRDNTVYKVNSYLLEFSEQVDPESSKIAAKLRRVNITACYLLPILFKTNAIIEDYLINYPQSEMVRSFKTIIANRKKKPLKDGELDYYWVWDKEGYNAISNYYYVDALLSFYRYYEQYEKPFLMGEDAEREKTMIEERYRAEMAALREREAALRERERQEIEEQVIAPLLKEIKKFHGYQASFSEFIVGGLAKSLNNSFSLQSERWESDKTLGTLPEERFVQFVKARKEPGLTDLLAWFAKLQLTTGRLFADDSNLGPSMGRRDLTIEELEAALRLLDKMLKDNSQDKSKDNNE